MAWHSGRVFYPAIRGLIRLFFPRIRVVGGENCPAEPAIYVGNHSQMYGPIACELYFPVRRYTWCAGEMMHRREVAAYAYRDFWSQKPRWTRPFYRLLSHLITPLSVCVFNNADTIPVYHDGRLIATFRQALARLQEGASMVIFPEHDVPAHPILAEFQDKFVDTARMYAAKTGKPIDFVPFYLAPKRRELHIGRPIRFDPARPIAEERQRICQELHREIVGIAEALPRHRVVPYRNIPKKDYPYNRPKED
ncbi:MAG: hypothetical protein E7458_01920 [Ruminococcaceae bacterium]|nr:hypothetical protein [Oscillospiraceae bacterium]